MDKLQLIKYASKKFQDTEHIPEAEKRESTRKELKGILVYAFSREACTERLRDKLSRVVSGAHLSNNI